MASDGAPQAAPMITSSSSSSSRDSEMDRKLQSATSLTIRTLQEITDDFSDQRKIGQGAYGKVYHAKLENGEEITVKMLYNNTPGIDDEQFKREFENLMRLEHQNIVRLVGYCYETQHQPMQYMGRTIFAERTYRALCFEYMQNGSLENHLSDECDGLDWLTRYKIIKGTCEGLKHLHEGFGEPIYHLDLKPGNILLDKNMVPKLADFGLSKLFSDKESMTTQSPMGTIGYVPMEFIHGNIISNKFDIFSLGVVMIKIIAGHGGYSRSAEMPRQQFLDLVHENWRNRMLKTYQVFQPPEAYGEQVKICTEIALSCMEIDRHKRPTIADIVHRLNDTETVFDKALSWGATQSLMTENMVKLEALTESEEVPHAESKDEYTILVRVTAPPWRYAEEISRPGVDLVVVVDLSSSYLLTIKEAMIMVINKLGSMDRLSIVSTSGDCIMELTFMSNDGRSFGRLMVNKLVGGADASPSVSVGNLVRSFGRLMVNKLVGGVDASPSVSVGNLVVSVGEGAKLLRGREVEEGNSRIGFIMVLLTLLEEGDSETLMPETSSEFPVHILDAVRYIADQKSRTYPYIPRLVSLDAADSEFNSTNHTVASYLADQTSGTYSLVGDMKDALELFIGGITKVAATSIHITLTAHEGVAIRTIDSGGYSSQVKSERRSGEIHIKDIYAGETKNFIVYLKLSEGKGKLLTIGGQYRSLNGSKQLLADTDVFVLRPSSGCSPEKLVMHPEVAAEFMRLRFLKIIWHIDRRTRENVWLKVRIWMYEDVLNCRPTEALSALDKEMEEILKQSDSYFLSCLSCHKWQRATSKGTCYDSGAFTRKC